MLNFIKNLFGGKSTQEFSVEINSKVEEKSKWDEISDMDIPSRDKIKLVEVQDIPVSSGEVLESKRKSKKYTIEIIPQKKGCFEHDENQKITVYVRQVYSKKLSGKYAFNGDSNNNTAIAGRWYDGNRYILEIISFEKQSKNT